MKGIILDFSIQTNSGIISGEDQKRYSFIGSEWKESFPPQRGLKIDFDLDITGQAIGVYKALDNSIRSNTHIINSTEKSEEDYNIFDWFVKCLKNYANFNGRARRKEFWFFYLALVVCNIFAMVLDSILETEVIFYGIVTLATIIPFLAVSTRRLHDIGKSGWWYLISLTIIGIILLIIWWAKEGDINNNQYGEISK
ncbi:DUF805 domain-containing protein [Acinetobacter variabilis]|uniref:DUF805 domain-containing protein n=1 Tax=Acinetobacter variabilis TaxID=70346 RepID=UPI00254A13F3|nr:DUF805 domain-containing protein [Acinetobacter variabilis]